MSELYNFIISCENGVNEEVLSKKFSHLKKIDLAMALNDLITNGEIEFKKSKGELVYFVKKKDKHDFESMILNILEKSGSTGLWLKDIKIKTNIPHNLLLKILKAMELSQKIKSIKSLNNNRKTYILYDVEPNVEVTGGIWFTNNDVDMEFIDKLMDIINRFIKDKQKTTDEQAIVKITDLATPEQIFYFLNNTKILEVKMTLDDCQTLINAMVYDGKIEKIDFREKIYLRAL
ncbi:hypothetical protein NUSPORA_00043 [Nucleospora cyclopteri]